MNLTLSAGVEETALPGVNKTGRRGQRVGSIRRHRLGVLITHGHPDYLSILYPHERPDSVAVSDAANPECRTVLFNQHRRGDTRNFRQKW